MKNAVDYYPYGKAMPGRSVYGTNYEGYRYQYTGHEKDGETGYQYHGARYYDEDLARYLSVDRYAMKFFHQSPYVYAGNMPVNRLDVNGDYSEDVAKGMAERGSKNGYTTKVVANPDKKGDFGVSFTRIRREGTYQKTQFDGKFTGIGQAGLTRKDDYIGNLKARISSTEAQGKVARQMGTDLEAARLADNVAPAGIQSAGTGRASDGRYYRGCMSCHSSAGAYADDVVREGWSEFGKASFQAGMLFGSAFITPAAGATTQGEQLFEIGDGVRRAKVAEQLGHNSIEAMDNAGNIFQVPLRNLRSPLKNAIDVSDPVSKLRYDQILQSVQQNGQKFPISVSPGNRGVTVPNIIFKF